MLTYRPKSLNKQPSTPILHSLTHTHTHGFWYMEDQCKHTYAESDNAISCLEIDKIDK